MNLQDTRPPARPADSCSARALENPALLSFSCPQFSCLTFSGLTPPPAGATPESRRKNPAGAALPRAVLWFPPPEIERDSRRPSSRHIRSHLRRVSNRLPI